VGNGDGVSETPDGKQSLRKLQMPEAIGAIPFLEMSPRDITSKLTETAVLLQLSRKEPVSALPISELIAAALDTRSNYWVEKALTWLERSPLSAPPLDSMRRAANDRGVNQHLRHRIMRTMRL
jgi:hypothetical protein